MDRITLLRALVRTVDTGSLTAAARELRVGQSTVSKWLAALEDEVGAPVLDRTTRSLHLTEAGRTLLPRARTLLASWDDAVAEVQAREATVQGRLRVALPAVFGTRHVVPHLGAFLDAHPLLELELVLADRYVSLVDEGFDVAIRVGVPVPSSLRAKRLGGTPRRLVASPAYLERRGRPAHPEDLGDHHALVHAGLSGAVWTFTQGERAVRTPVAGRVTADHSEALRQLAVQGQGIALLAGWLVADDIAAGRLVSVLDRWQAPPAPIRALLPPSREVPSRVRALLDHLERCWAGSPLRAPR